MDKSLIIKMKSLTLDDIYCNDNNNINISADNQGDNKISKYNILYNPKRKIKRNIYQNLKVKHYIKIGEECPICYESINNRHDCYLTDCGHSFHYSCISNYEYHTKYNSNICCPICRQYMGYYDNIKDKYPNSKNEIDKLEDFENNIKTKLPKICFDFHELKYKNHFYLMNYKNCFYCRL